MKNSVKKVLAVALAITTCFGLASCGKKQDVADGKVKISISGWPEKGTDEYDKQMKKVEQFNEIYPDIEITGDTYSYAVNTFSAKASAGTLPTLYRTWFTEVDKIIEGGYAADLTDALKNAGWFEQMNGDIVKYVSADDGKVYGIPFKVYAQGLYINKALFKQAGLVDENGNVKIPETFDDVYEYAKIVKQKTGKAGFGIATMNNQGGWHSVNIAWAYGADFLAKKDGKYVSTLNSSETVAAYEWIKKMRAANVFPDNPNVQGNDLQTLYASGQLAMFFGEPAYINGMVQSFGMKPEDIILTSMPAGPKGRMTQMGGDLYMIANNATPEQIDACFKWIDFIGEGPTLEDEKIERMKESYKTTLDNNGVVLPREAFYLWKSEERVQKLLDARKDYANIPEENLDTYMSFEGVTLMPEPEAGCQELYSELDKIVQEIFADSKANIPSLVKAASDNWQINCLDNLK